jgi:hypothetical protein
MPEDEEQRALLEKLNGPLKQIPKDEEQRVFKMNREQRRKWYREQRKKAKAQGGK